MCGYQLVASITFMRDTKKLAHFRAGVADTLQKHTKGLMHCTDIKPSEALFFIWNYPDNRSFWMENTPKELAIIFVDTNKKVIAIRHGKPFSRKQLPSGGKAQFVIETLWKSAQKIRVGDRVIIQ